MSHRTRLAFLIGALSLATVAAAPTSTAPAPRKPVAASSPTEVRSLSEAKTKFEAARRNATTQYVRDLQELKKRLLKAENLEEANAVNEAIAEAERDLSTKPIGDMHARRFIIQSKGDWQQTVSVKKGDILEIKASGEWCVNDQLRSVCTYGPDGLRADGTAEVHGQWSILMARIGFKVYLVGKECRIVAPQDGVLEFRSNDFNLGDNAGTLAVSIAQ